MTGRVLVVDDIDGNIRLSRSLPDVDGHELIVVWRGVEVLATVAGLPQVSGPVTR